ncbi:MAG: hypothetical protein IT353_11480 [Gemmatimonadaceae bacterium]|nr:hypothetical protein [Gemmatimonadaceae bacterium]
MLMRRWSAVVVPVALATVATASVAQALPDPERRSERTLFSWSGTVDREVLIVIRGRQVETRAAGLDASFAPRLEVRDDLPRSMGAIEASLAEGRGEAEIVQQPSARNDYTAMVRLRDTRGGADRYRLVVAWRSTEFNDRNGPPFGGGWGRDDRDRDNDRNRDRGRDRDDRWDDRFDDRGRFGRDEGRFAWSGDVDDVAEIRIQGRRVEYRTRSGAPLRNERSNLRGAGLPRRSVNLELNVLRGRGSVVVIQEPSRRNDFTAIIRIIDKRGGYGDYDFDLRWF